MRPFFKRTLAVIGSAMLLFSFAACTSTSDPIDDDTDHPRVEIVLSNEKTVLCELYPDVAPITVQNFLNLVDKGFYNGTIFHRAIPDFVVQGGGYYVSSGLVSQYLKKECPAITGEFKANGIENDLSHKLGVMSMARTEKNYNSATSEFFICVADCSYLDGQYAAFGKVVDYASLQNVIELSKAETTTLSMIMEDFPVDPVTIVSINRK